MSKLEKLIAELCPDGVEYKSIREIAEVGTGNSNGNESVDNGLFPFFVRSQTIKSKDDYEYDEEAIIIPGEGGIGEIFHYINGKYALHQRVYRIHFIVEDVNTKFAYYYMQAYFKPFILKKAVSATVTSIRKPMIEDFPLPVPPLPVQREIVRILDNFTELTAELTARKQQYAYYRDKLLDKPHSSTKIITIGELGSWSGGKTPSMDNSDYWEDGTMPWITSKDMKVSTLEDTEDHITEKAISEASMTVYPPNGVAVVTRSGILKHTLPVAFVPFATTVNQDIKMLVAGEGVLPRYAFHAIQGKSPDILAKAKKPGGTVDSLEFKKFLDYEIPLPSLEVQKRLVEVLDNFDAICTDLSSGLPAEIEARQKQYEYYRDKLLTFREISN